MTSDNLNEFEASRKKIEQIDKFAIVRTKEEFLGVVSAMSDVIHMPESEKQKLVEKIENVFRDPARLAEIFPKKYYSANFRNALKRISDGPQN